MTAEETLDRLYALLGEVVILPIPRGKKAPELPAWQKLTYAESKERRDELVGAVRRGGNIGVLLGPASDRLLALDLDDDELVVEWLNRHPWLADTLRSRGKRGNQLWLRLEPDCSYPNGKAVYKLTEGDKVAGELRLGGAGGAQSVIYGFHPAGMRYQIVVDKPPIVISLADLDELAPGVLAGDEQKQDVPGALASNSSKAALPPNIRERVERYLDKGEPAVSGQRGHDTTFRLLSTVINGFALSPEEAWAAALYYNHKCEPPWSEKELKHKVHDALNTQHDKPRGYLLDGGMSSETPLSKRLKQEKAQAEQAGAEPPSEPSQSEHSKKPQLILPSGDVSITESATNLFTQLAKTRRYFARGRLVVEVVRNKEGNEVLSPLRAIAFRSRIEKDFKLLVWRSPKGEAMLKPAHCPKDITEAFLESDPAIDYLPGISLLVSSPILAEQQRRIGCTQQRLSRGSRWNLR